MARAYYDRTKRIPIFSNERGVGIGMANDRGDVMLIQLLLRAILHGEKAMPRTTLRFRRPPGPTLGIHGAWDEASKNYLDRWEYLYNLMRQEAQHFRVDLPDYVEPVTLYPGKVVPFAAGGQKVIAMGRMCALMFGDTAYASLRLPETGLPDVLAKQIFYR